MATSIFGLLLNSATDASFRAWGSALSAQIGSMLTRVEQSNDIDWTTVTRPQASEYAGTEVYRFNDPLQSTTPIFLRIKYGAGDNQSSPKMQISIGKDADGAGILTGVLLADTDFQSGGEAAAPSNCYISSGASWFALSLAPADVGNLGGYLAIERSTEGTAGAIHVAIQTASFRNQSHRFIDYETGVSETVGSGIVAIPLSLSTDRSLANATVAPIFPAACISPSGLYWRPRVILGAARQNAGLGEVITGLIDGHSYLSLGAGSRGSDQRNGDFATTLIRWN